MNSYFMKVTATIIIVKPVVMLRLFFNQFLRDFEQFAKV